MLRLFLSFLLACLLAACGGGGGGAPSNQAPVARAGADISTVVGTVATLDGSASSDADGDPLQFSWRLAAAPVGSTAALVAATSARATLQPDLPGSYTLTLTVNDGQGGTHSANVTVLATANVPVQIVLGAAEPLQGTVQLSLSGTVRGAVTWYLDLQSLGSGGGGAGAPLNWDTLAVANGSHLLLAQVLLPGGAVEEVRRTVSVSNSQITVAATPSGTTGSIHVDVEARSPHSISSVSAALDGLGMGTLTAPNACSLFCVGVNDRYRFTIDAAAVGSGSHSLVVTVVDGSGATRTVTVPVPVSNPPLLQLQTPDDGLLLHGSLQLSATARTDKAGGLTHKAYLGDVLFLSGAGGQISGSYDLTGLAPGPYVLTVQAADAQGQVSQVQRTVVVSSSPALAYAPWFTLPTSAQLLAVEGPWLALRLEDRRVLLRQHQGGADAWAEGAADIQYLSDWQLRGGWLYAFGKGSDCPQYCVYRWSMTGVRSNLTLANPYSRSSPGAGAWSWDQHPVARGSWVAWVNDQISDSSGSSGRYTLYDSRTGNYTRIAPAPGIRYVGNWNYDLAEVGGVVHFFYWGQTAGSGIDSVFEVFHWRSDTGLSVALTAAGVRSVYTLTDGERVAWRQSPVGGSADGTMAVVSRPLAGGATSTVSSRTNDVSLADGVLVWTEASSSSRLIRAATTTQTSTLSTALDARLLGNAGGQVLYGHQGRVYTWDASTGLSRLRLEALPAQAVHAPGVWVFSIGSTVYRLAL